MQKDPRNRKLAALIGNDGDVGTKKNIDRRPHRATATILADGNVASSQAPIRFVTGHGKP